MKLISKRGRKKADKILQEQVDELYRCAINPIYFINTYFKVSHPSGPQPFVLRPYQEDYLKLMMYENQSVAMLPRMSGSTTVSIAYMLWEALFYHNRNYMICTQQIGMIRDISAIISYALFEIPSYLRPRTTIRAQKNKIEFDNGSKLYITLANLNMIAGNNIYRFYFDNFAQVTPKHQHDIWASIIPLTASGSKITINSVPNTKTDLFAKIWEDANLRNNTFTPMKIVASQVPQYDDSFRQMMRKALGDSAYRREYECEFV